MSSSSSTKKMHMFALVIQLYITSLPHGTIITTHAFSPCATSTVYKTIPSGSATFPRTKRSPNALSYLPSRRRTSSCSWSSMRRKQSTQQTEQEQKQKQEHEQEQEQEEIINIFKSSKVHYRTNNNKQDRLLTKDQEEFFDSLDEHIYGGPFLEKVRDLQEFKNIHGTCHVPKRYADNPALGNWVNKSRQMYRKYIQGENTSMTKERIDILNKMGFLWSGTTHNVPNDRTLYYDNDDNRHHNENNHNHDELPSCCIQNWKEKSWNENYQQIKDLLVLQRQHDTSNKSMLPNAKLGVWAANQRREYQKWYRGEITSITKERIDLLNAIGFDWNPWDTKWKTRIKQLKEYRKENGHCMVPVNYEKNPKLGRWVATQRKYYNLYKNGKPTSISKERIQELTDIGFVWNRWEDGWLEESCFPVENRLSHVQRK